jgi:hypothetical protein
MTQAPVWTITAKSSLHKVVHGKADGEVKVKCDGELLVEISMVLNLRYALAMCSKIEGNI